MKRLLLIILASFALMSVAEAYDATKVMGYVMQHGQVARFGYGRIIQFVELIKGSEKSSHVAEYVGVYGVELGPGMGMPEYIMFIREIWTLRADESWHVDRLYAKDTDFDGKIDSSNCSIAIKQADGSVKVDDLKDYTCDVSKIAEEISAKLDKEI